MQTHPHHPMKTVDVRSELIARADPRTIEDACSFAWMQLVARPAVDLDPPGRRVLWWLTQTAVREAWQLQARRAREELHDHAGLERAQLRHHHTVSDAEQLVAQRARLGLVAEVPERPRRFLLRHALGHSYREIAAQEDASLTTTNKQIARARRLLRALDAPQQPEPCVAERVSSRAPATARQRAA